QRVGQGGELHSLALAEAHPLPGVSRVGTEQQRGGEFDAPGGSGPEELDPRREPAGRAESGGHSIHRRKLPPAEDSDPGIPGWRPTRLGRQVYSATRGTHAHGFGGGGAVAPSAASVNPVVPLTHTVQHSPRLVGGCETRWPGRCCLQFPRLPRELLPAWF